MVHDANVYLAQSAAFKRLHAARRARGILINQMTGHGHVDLAFADVNRERSFSSTDKMTNDEIY